MSLCMTMTHVKQQNERELFTLCKRKLIIMSSFLKPPDPEFKMTEYNLLETCNFK